MNINNKKIIYILPVFLTFFLFLAGIYSGLEVFVDITDPIGCNGDISCNLKRLHVLVADDVTIVLRIAKRFLEYGNTNFNAGDSAQAATSYILPIIASVLFFLPDSIAVLIFSFFGFMSIYLVWVLISKGKEFSTKLDLVFIIFINSTISAYMLSGWEHMHQSLLILLTWIILLRSGNNYHYIVVGILSGLAILMRIDSIFLIMPVFLYIIYNKNYNYFFIASIAGLITLSIYFYFQLSWFQYITPTAARLKAGFFPDFSYNTIYLIKNILYGSCIAYIFYVFMCLVVDKFYLKNKASYFIILGVFLNILYAFVVSDVFSYGRMYIASFSMVLFLYYQLEDKKLPRIGIFIIIVLWFTLYVPKKLINIIISPLYSNTEAQYILSKDIKKAIMPKDGSIGLFYLGATSFVLDEYEITDFLGKADERIANLNVKEGQPIGHNKFDAKISLNNWNVAVVPFPRDVADLSIDESFAVVNKKDHYYFFHEVKLELLKREYSFCIPNTKISWGVYVRKDLTNKFKNCDVKL